MGFFKKKSPKNERPTDTINVKKKKSEKSLKPKAPKSLAGKTFIRYAFWTLTIFIFFRGCVSFVQGEKVVQQINNYGTEQVVIPESVKGFAVDFATEYFTWNEKGLNDRGTQVDKFIEDIDQDAGLKPYDIKGNSKVISAEVYNANQIDDHHIDVTVLVRREMLLPKIASSNNKTSGVEIDSVLDKSYVVVPVTLERNGYVIKQYPRFVSADPKSNTREPINRGLLVDDELLIQRSKELAENFLTSWYESNITQLKYFYLVTKDAPNNVPKTNYILDRDSVISVNLYHPLESQENANPDTYLLEATIVVKNELGEKFTNSWTLEVKDQADRLYVISVGPNYKSTEIQKKHNDETDQEQIPENEPTLPDSDFDVPLQNEDRTPPSNDHQTKDPTIDPNEVTQSSDQEDENKKEK